MTKLHHRAQGVVPSNRAGGHRLPGRQPYANLVAQIERAKAAAPARVCPTCGMAITGKNAGKNGKYAPKCLNCKRVRARADYAKKKDAS